MTATITRRAILETAARQIVGEADPDPYALAWARQVLAIAAARGAA